MKQLTLSLGIILCHLIAFSQTEISKRIDVKNGQEVSIECLDANLINVTGWDENYISLLAKVRINNGQNDDAYLVNVSTEKGTIHITGSILDKDQLPKMIQIKKGDQIYTFNTDDKNSPEIQQFYNEQGKDGIQWFSHGVMWHIDYEIMIPQSVNLNITSKHGLIEIDNYRGPISANSKHGGVDMAISPNSKSEINLSTDWGEVFTDLNLKYNEIPSGNKTVVSCRMNGGGGPSVILESKHGNIYFREMK